MLVIPWRLLGLCIAHPTGHDHPHEFGKLTPCEIRAKDIRDVKETGIWPSMVCHTFIIEVDEFQIQEEESYLVDQKQQFAAYIDLATVALLYPQEPYLMPPDPYCRSATTIGPKQLRAPPIV